jgi:hypothetical protein
LQPQPTNEFAIQRTAPRLQSPIPQDSPTVFSLCGASPVRPSEDSSVMTSVSTTTFKSANQFSSYQLDQLNSITDNQDHSQTYAKHPSAQEASARPALEYVDQKLDSFFQGIDSQVARYLQTPENGQAVLVPASMPHFPGENEPWDLKTGREVKQAWRSRCRERPQSSTAHRNANQQEPAAIQASPSNYRFLAASTPSYSHGYHDAPTQISEMTSVGPQIRIPCSVPRNPPFAAFCSSGPGAHIAPGDIYYNSMAPEGLEVPSPGSFHTRMPQNVSNATDLMSPSSLLSQPSPAPGDQDKIFNDSGRTYLLKPVHVDNAIHGTNFALGCNSSTLGDCDMPLSSTIGAGFTLTRPHDVVFSQDFLPSNQIANSSNSFTIPGYSTDHDVGNSNLTYVQSHDMLHSSFPSDDFELFSSSRGPPSARHNHLPCQIRPHEESTFYSSRPSLVSPNFQSCHPPSVPQPPNVWANAPIMPHIWYSTTSKEEGGFMEYDVMEEGG